MKEYIRKNLPRLIVTGIHMLLTFLWAGRVFMGIGINPVGTIEMKSRISTGFQTAVTYIFTELFALVIIYCIWRLFFFLLADFKKIYIVFLAIWILGGILVLSAWPQVFGLDDNVVTYSYAVHLVPDYWHSFYHSVIYGGCLLVFPLDFMVTLLQWSAFVFMLGFLFLRVERVAGHAKWAVFTLLLLPNSWMIATYGHRIMIYMILALIYFTVLIFDLIEGKETSDLKDILMGLFGAFLSVYRSEGILIGAPVYLIFLLFKKKRSIRDTTVKAVIFAVMFVAFSLPQKMGAARYYGNDYSIYNTCERLKVIFNEPEANLDYAGAGEDILAIDRLVSVDWLKEYGLDAYRATNNGLKGSPDINQTRSGEEGKAYMKAYSNICRHNLLICVKDVFNNFIHVTTGKPAYVLGQYTGVSQETPGWYYDAFDRSSEEFFGNRHTALIVGFTEKLKTYEKFFNGLKKTFESLKKAYVYLGWLVALVLFNTISALYHLIKAIGRKDITVLWPGLFAVFAVGLTLAVIITMPLIYTPYLITGEYMMLFSVLTFFMKYYCGKRTKVG
ncbi:MAG: hypothetical protein K6E32_09990 [Lachnospiraceae bacterium]|nr:hypothetical protein [Lachnospiraceae bacterium]